MTDLAGKPGLLETLEVDEPVSKEFASSLEPVGNDFAPKSLKMKDNIFNVDSRRNLFIYYDDKPPIIVKEKAC